MSISEFFGDFSDYTPERMREHGSLKWTAHPGSIGAWVAEMDFGVAPAIAELIRHQAASGTFGYMPPAVSEDARLAVREWYREHCGWEIPDDAVRLYPDVLTALEATLLHLVHPDQPVVVPTPSYMPFLTVPALFDREIIQVPSLRDSSGRYRLDLDGIDAALSRNGGLLILCNPWNPVGRVLTRAELKQVEEVVVKNGARVFADEIHAPVILEPELTHIPYASISPAAAAHTVTATSNSKGWNIPGLKCAQMIVTAQADRQTLAPWDLHYEKLASPLGARCAAVAYRDCADWLAAVTEVLRGNRYVFAHELSECAPEAIYRPAEGTYLAWVDLRPYGVEHAAEVLRGVGLAVNDGADCGAPGFARVNLAMAPDNVRAAACCIGQAVSR